jgi:hypothetical protein
MKENMSFLFRNAQTAFAFLISSRLQYNGRVVLWRNELQHGSLSW